jgi:ATP-dependent RNA helicase RhlE
VEEDPGLELISRRPPKQKYANFEEYMAARGGATAPIPGAEPETGLSGGTSAAEPKKGTET